MGGFVSRPNEWPRSELQSETQIHQWRPALMPNLRAMQKVACVLANDKTRTFGEQCPDCLSELLTFALYCDFNTGLMPMPT